MNGIVSINPDGTGEQQLSDNGFSATWQGTTPVAATQHVITSSVSVPDTGAGTPIIGTWNLLIVAIACAALIAAVVVFSVSRAHTKSHN